MLLILAHIHSRGLRVEVRSRPARPCSTPIRDSRFTIYDSRLTTHHSPVKRHLLIYGIFGGLLIVLLKTIEYRFLIVERSLEIYGGLIALFFASVGIWLGLKLTKKKETVVIKEVPVEVKVEVPVPTREPFALDQSRLQQLGITTRELEILTLIAGGLSNREIAEKLFVSENTVKTHSSRLLDKLSAKRRTQAVQIAKEMRLIP
jgi:two-component system, NarL family, response regulator LiaR